MCLLVKKYPWNMDDKEDIRTSIRNFVFLIRLLSLLRQRMALITLMHTMKAVLRVLLYLLREHGVTCPPPDFSDHPAARRQQLPLVTALTVCPCSAGRRGTSRTVG